jgi:hypothetical protein
MTFKVIVGNIEFEGSEGPTVPEGSHLSDGCMSGSEPSDLIQLAHTNIARGNPLVIIS